MKRIVFLALVLAACSASAQVTKCKLPNGTITYGDGPCPAGAVDSRVNTTANVVDGSGERAAAARIRSDALPREESSSGAGTGFSSQATARPIDEQACRSARRDLDMASSRMRTEVSRGNHPGRYGVAVKDAEYRVDAACGSDIAGARARSAAARPTPAAAPAQPEGPAAIVNCDPAGCWDTAGRRYNNAAGGNFHRSDGAFCTRAGPNAVCN